jgi:cell division protein FtsL
MTNSSDFRRYAYSADASYALEAFNAHRTAAAPAYQPLRRQRKRELRVHENTRLKSEQQLHTEGRMAAKQAAILVVSVLVTLGMLGGVLFTFAQKNKLNHEVASINRQISEAQSESTRLNSQLVSVEMIDQYAVEKLGMSKMQSGQMRYVDVDAYMQARAKAQKTQPSPGAYAHVVRE